MDLLTTGIYSIPDAARLVRVSPARMRGWFQGYSQATRGPLLSNQLERIDSKAAITFINLIEARFIREFARHGVSIQSIRVMAENAQEMLESDHPFATNIVFQTDGKIIYAILDKTVDDTKDKGLLNLKSKNYAFYEIIKESLRKGVEYSSDGLAKSWYPRKNDAPNVIVHPSFAFGRPVTDKDGVPTRALFDAFQGEGETYESVGYWYDVPPEIVKQAVKFEWGMKAAVC